MGSTKRNNPTKGRIFMIKKAHERTINLMNYKTDRLNNIRDPNMVIYEMRQIEKLNHLRIALEKKLERLS